MPASPDPGLPPERPQVPHPPRPPRPPRPPGGRDGAPDVLPPGTEPVDDVVSALLGEPRTMRRRQVSAAAEVSLLSARRFWHALGFPNVGDEDTVFTAADLQALRSVVGLVREGSLRGDDRAVDDPGAGSHHRPAGGLADPADGGGPR